MYFDVATIGRGAAYAQQGRVALDDWDPLFMSATGTCVGSSGELYSLEIGFGDGARGYVVDVAECDCPVGANCKHAVALALGVMRAGLLGALPHTLGMHQRRGGRYWATSSPVPPRKSRDRLPSDCSSRSTIPSG